MKNRRLTSMAGGLAVFLLAGNLSSAGTINQREWQQQARIWRGYRSGDLTPREFRRLEREQALIRRSEARARRCDFTARESMRIQREQDRASRHIFRQSHDRQYWR
ncbi:MAG TPA: hypothetical protein VFS12_04105 [Terriglobia bacterium]|nr:hypothetical protein [Terriglobia bacterium]